jgi:hypothetical protein
MKVICLRPLPSLFISHISAAPLRVVAKAICSDPPIGVGKGVFVVVGDGDGVTVDVGDGVFVADGVLVGEGVLDSTARMGTLVFWRVTVTWVEVRIAVGMAYPTSCLTKSGLIA